MSYKPEAAVAISTVASAVNNLPAFIVGSAVAAAQYSKPYAYDDVDVFVPTTEALFVVAERLRNHNFIPNERFQRVYQRWMTQGMKGWHTNSLKLENQAEGIDVNIVFKKVNKNPLTSLAQVVESFDFGLLAVGGYDAQLGVMRDMRNYMFPTETPDARDTGTLPFLPGKQEAWENGFISQYNGLREIGRYVKYKDYGYDMSRIREPMLQGYWIVSDYHLQSDAPDRQALGHIYQSIAMHLEQDNDDKLRVAGKTILFEDSLDTIMKSLE